MTYQLTSPHFMHGPGIKTVQEILAGKNVKKVNFHPGTLDGVYGEGTASAVKRAKWALGYASKDVNTVCGPHIVAYLTGKEKLPDDYVKRAKVRAGAAVHKTGMRDKAFAAAVSKVGTKESPAGSNIVEFSKWYGVTGAWCAMFMSWCYVGAGSKAFAKGTHYAYVPYILNDAQGHKYGLSVTAEPVQGDLVLFDWNGDGTCDHVGMFDAWTDKAHGAFKTVEGNTGVGNDSNGGEVMRRDRNKSMVRAFVRVSV